MLIEFVPGIDLSDGRDRVGRLFAYQGPVGPVPASVVTFIASVCVVTLASQFHVTFR